jgi:predicted nucleic acid-binding Zn ribbon protein
VSDSAQEKPRASAGRDLLRKTPTTASDDQSCRQCGGPIRGRRRNGFCSDRCRMRVKREEEAERRRTLMSRLEEAVAAVALELVGDDALEDYADANSDERTA